MPGIDKGLDIPHEKNPRIFLKILKVWIPLIVEFNPEMTKGRGYIKTPTPVKIRCRPLS